MPQLNQTPLPITLLFSSLLLFFSFSCKHEPTLIPGTRTICFSSEILPVFQSNCALSGCHSSGSGGRPDLSTYEGIAAKVTAGKPVHSELYQTLVANTNSERHMPPSSHNQLSDAQISLINLWILQGAQNTQCDPNGCDTTNVTFSGAILPLVNNYCTGCHSGNDAGGGIQLVDYASIKTAVESGRLVGAVNHDDGFEPMPQNSNKLSDCRLRQIAIWINNGMPNN